MKTTLRIAAILMSAHLTAWVITFVALIGFSPELVLVYFIDGWSFSAGELPSLVWLYSWVVFLVVVGVSFGTRWLLLRRAADA